MTQRLIAFSLIILLALVALSASEHRVTNADLPVVNADYQLCARINPGPLDGPPPGKTRTDYRTRYGGNA